MSLLVLSVMAIAGFSVGKMAAADTAGSALDLSARKAGQMAEAGLQASLHNTNNSLGSASISKVTFPDGGAFVVTADTVNGTITSTGTYGEASKTYTIDAAFAADCFSVDFGNANYGNYQGWGKLGNVMIRKSCSELDSVQIQEVRVLFSNPHPARRVQDITLNDTTSIYHMPAAIPGYPAGATEVGLPSGGAQSKEVIDSQDYTFSTGDSQSLSVWWNTTFTTPVPLQIQLVFVDGSSYTSAVKVLP